MVFYHCMVLDQLARSIKQASTGPKLLQNLQIKKKIKNFEEWTLTRLPV